MWEENGLHRALLVMLGLTMVIGLVISEEPLDARSKSVQFSYEDISSGVGFFASNNKITSQGPHADARVQSRLAEVALQKKGHGSGLIESKSIIKSIVLVKNQTNPGMIYAYGLIAALDNHSMVYVPQTMSAGSGYYTTHLLNFSSLLSDMTQIKNYASETSMGQEIEYAHAINMDLAAHVEDDYSGWNPSKGLAKSLMDLDGDITSGTAHLKMLQGGPRMSKRIWSRPDIDVDQVYTGTFGFATKMNLTVPVTKIVSEDSWLPCCSDGWEGLTNSDKKSYGADTKAVFDCTCPRVVGTVQPKEVKRI